MTDKITLLPRMVRGLGNIVMAKTVDNFLPRTGRVMQDTDTVNGINRTVFRVQHEGVSMTPVYLDVTAPSVVDVSVENITFTVALKKESDDSVVTGQTVKYLIDDEINEVSTGSSGTVTVTVPNTFETGTHTITFLFNTISSYSGCYRVVNITVGDGELELELLPVKTVFGSGTVVPLLAKLTTAGVGVKNSVVYFWERYISSVLRLFLPGVVGSGGAVEVSASFRDSDGSAIKDALVYFWERYVLGGLRFTPPSAFQDTVDLVATLVDEDGSRVKGEQVEFYETFVPTFLRFDMEGAFLLAFFDLRDDDGNQLTGKILKYQILDPTSGQTVESDIAFYHTTYLEWFVFVSIYEGYYIRVAVEGEEFWTEPIQITV